MSHSSTEAELVSLDCGIRTEAIPLLGLWSEILDVLHPVEKVVGDSIPANDAVGVGGDEWKLRDDSMVSVDTLDYVLLVCRDHPRGRTAMSSKTTMQS